MSRPIAVVTGASRGIGKAIAIDLARGGYDVVISARTIRPGEIRDNALTVKHTDFRLLPGSLEETAAAITALGGRAFLLPMDLIDRKSVEDGARRIVGEWGNVEILVHNGRYVGPGSMDPFLDTPIDAYEKYLEAHCLAPLVLTRAILPGMIERGRGNIIMISSSAAYEAPPAPAGRGGWGLAYSVGKAAGHKLVETIDVEHRAQGIRAFNLHPGFIATERSEAVLGDHGIDVSKAARPPLVASVVTWLITSDDATRYCGKNIEAQPLARELNLKSNEWIRD